MALVTDIFNANGWGAVEFHEEIVERTVFRPSLLGGLNIFEPIYARTRTIAVQLRGGTMSLIPTSEMGAPPVELEVEDDSIRKFDTVRLAKGSTVYAAQLAGLLALPFEMQTRDVASEIADRTRLILEDLDLTMEHMRFGAVQGKVIDATGREIVDWFKFWGITRPTPIVFELDKEATDVRKKIRDLKRKMLKAAKGNWTPGARIAGLVGDEFFDLLVNHKQIKETKLGTERAATLENIEGYSQIEIEGVIFINYRGTDDGSTLAIASDEARFFPLGLRGAFKIGYSPANEFKPYLNQRAREHYGLLLADTSGREAWDRVEIYSYPLPVATLPETLISGKAK
ncbi:major capsid protein [Aureimonas phyllosphaerae]|uniref:Phage major capsid protein E n=1 Tax=Aureimonas phyllosphaerae TaxID=1166078 RepID=A0A7W6BTU3_9HYPH|nr:major capsid protein [Aureimonas phyllosphaerae]MBB3937928.1 hypothetical protein [Aureimonas phyllosphaerae]MBB3961899.1 hypothetical protein [Aureimonas phyllosphaerae]SFF54541.1 Phage major capsid protein E [Aureimonas phyllosphaerae]